MGSLEFFGVSSFEIGIIKVSLPIVIKKVHEIVIDEPNKFFYHDVTISA